ncbi:hypothetical protein [Pseudovibrio sp. Ad37]|uniref:hypothetical protein n=1 Tax=Pseudovibrio sp. Ad37 TaxID=989422 RepID=UPI0007B1BF2F|nr:hypothetical protein [Pseudovibrio sp. Ad37]KZL18697.1 hypothetical protein PsAD37_03820 [Pseudovibrio sp. Ad37]
MVGKSIHSLRVNFNVNLFGEIAPVKAEPVALYLGGKSQLAGRIIGQINQVSHLSYVDVFCGRQVVCRWKSEKRTNTSLIFMP